MSAVTEYGRWLKSSHLDEALRREMEQMTPQMIEDSFYTNIEFGTAGMRGVMGAGTNRINIHTIRKATEGFARYLEEIPGAKERGIAIGYDNRHDSRRYAFDSAAVLAGHGIRSYVFDSLCPTPELSFAVRYYHCAGGIMITASHNPKQYNGYKLYDEKGCQLVPALADEVSRYVGEVTDELTVGTLPESSFIEVIGGEIDRAYFEAVKAIRINPEERKELKVVFSPEHGTANIPVRTILSECGFEVIPVEEQCTPDPDFSMTPTPNPEQKGAYELALRYARETDADIILVCDPDADRMGVGVRHNDEYILLTGNQSGAVLIEYILSQRKRKGLLKPDSVMFNTVVTSDLGDRIAGFYGVQTEKTLTGFKFIGEKIAAYEETGEKNYAFGYEESYGSLIEPFVRDKDAQQACLMLAEAANHYKAEGRTLYDVLLDAYDRFGAYYETQTSLVLEGEDGARRIRKMMEDLRQNSPQSIGDTAVIRCQDFDAQTDVIGNAVQPLTGFTKSNVLKYFLADGSWIAIRPSGTEPKIKVYYCITDKIFEQAEEKCGRLIQAMKQYIA